MRGRGIHQRTNRLRRQGDSLFNRRQLRLKFRYSRGGLFLWPVISPSCVSKLAAHRRQLMTSVGAIAEADRKRQRGVAAGGANP